MPLTLADIRAAASRIAGRVVRTPTIESPAVSRECGAIVLLKLDNLQATGAFKERGAANPLALLSPREREIMDLLAQGLTGEQVAERLVLSAETVKTHIRNAMNKLEASTRVHAAIALREGYISGPASAQ